MARRENELFIGSEYLNIEGRSIKHPALIKHYGTINVNKLKNEPINLVGLDLETNHLTAELRLLGIYRNNNITQYTSNFLDALFDLVKWCHYKEHHIAYWNKLDPQVLFKQVLLAASEKQRYEALARFGKTSGRWDRKLGQWMPDNPPIIEIDFRDYKFGISNVIRSSIQFFFYSKGNKKLKQVWAYDIAQLYALSIESEATYNLGTKDSPKPRLSYYTKVDKSAHLVDWDRYQTDLDYRHNIVNYSNALDARAVYDLGMMIQEDFKKAFGYYLNTLVSSGSMARAGIVATIFNHYKVNPLDDNVKGTESYEKAVDDIRSIAFINHYDKWLDTYGGDILKNLFAISTESYKGGYIEALRLGYVKEAYYADIASAYPAFIAKLYDLRDSKLTTGFGIPPKIPYSYCFVRGIVTIPEHINIHPLTVKHPTSKETNIRPVGTFRASYLLEEREYLISLGASFSDEEWVNVETNGKLSPFAEVASNLTALRTELIKANNSAEYVVKKTNNSGYGITFEAVPTHIEKGNTYSIKSIENLIDGVIGFLWNDEYDFKLSKSDINNIAKNASDKLSNYSTKKSVSKYIANEIMLKCYAVDPFDNQYLKDEFNVLKGYVKNIHLKELRDEMYYKYDKQYTVPYRIWHNEKGMYYDDVVNEVEASGIKLEGQASIDQLFYMFDLYQSLKESLKPKKIGIDELVDIDRLEKMHQIIELEIYNGLVDVNDIIIENVGFRAGEFFNPIYAAWITSQTRLTLSKAGNTIEARGGKPILLMTDSIFWEGTADMMPKDLVREEKTTGYFEKPSKVTDMLCLGSGRYEYTDAKGRQLSKQRGLNTSDWQSDDGVDVSKFSWMEAITNPKHILPNGKISVNVRTLVSVGLVLHSPKRIEPDGIEVGYDIKDLGLIKETKREVDALIGYTKRIFNESPKTDELSKRMIQTRPLSLGYGLFGVDGINDQTLPILREKMFKLEPISKKERIKATNRKTSSTFYNRNKEDIRQESNTKYAQLRNYGYTRNEARKMANWNSDKIMEKLVRDEKI